VRVYSIEAPTNPTTLFELLGARTPQTSFIGLQAPEGNSNIVYFGDVRGQPFELRAKASAGLPTTNTKGIYVKGTPPDKLTVGLL